MENPTQKKKQTKTDSNESEVNMKNSDSPTIRLLGLLSEGISKTGSAYLYLSVQNQSGDEVGRLFLSPLEQKGLGAQLHEPTELVGRLKDGVSAKTGRAYQYLSVSNKDDIEAGRLFLSPIETKALFPNSSHREVTL